jgi:hypothetical protein
MVLETSRNIVTSLRGSAFRLAAFDGRTRILRSIPTISSLPRSIRTHRSLVRYDRPRPNFQTGR